MTDDEVRALVTRLLSQPSEAEAAEVVEGVLVAWRQVRQDWPADGVEAAVRTALAFPPVVGMALEHNVREACEQLALALFGLRLLRTIAPESVIWPPEVGPPPADEPIMAPGPKLVQ